MEHISTAAVLLLAAKLHVLGNWGLFLATVESLMVMTTVAVFVHECLYLSACWPTRPLVYSSLALSVFPVSF
ncbi:hypothetical protein IscW_ISCW008853 [Ixodes scapularis]|uniref:Uncharacterized protein n=1 Tax=Ixodes scapularis TaxID=6945 RepID=B7PYS6_IXOSC|nr:hypothetical protein IscW_ISCW008853 [Ixodes scapularis]|eukprot:XP_002403812.1 hypothetical protein IscW_ISCW008853 [Ixodes scapularis]